MPTADRAFVELVTLLEQLQRDAVAEMSATGDAWRETMLRRRTATHIVIGQCQALTRKIRCWLTRPEDVEPLDNAEALAEELATWKPDQSLSENSGREFDKLAQRLPRVKKRLLDLQAKVQATCGTAATHAELLAKAKERRQEIDLDGHNDAALAGQADWLRAAWPRLFEIGANDRTHPCLHQEWLIRVPLLEGQRLEGLNPVDVRDAYSQFIDRLAAGLQAMPSPATETRPERLLFADDGQTIILDDTPYTVGDPKTFALYREIAKGRPTPKTKAALQVAVPGCKGIKTIPGLLNRLPEPLRDTVLPGGPHGYAVTLKSIHTKKSKKSHA